jgi:hypothetical protein
MHFAFDVVPAVASTWLVVVRVLVLLLVPSKSY